MDSIITLMTLFGSELSVDYTSTVQYSIIRCYSRVYSIRGERSQIIDQFVIGVTLTLVIVIQLE